MALSLRSSAKLYIDSTYIYVEIVLVNEIPFLAYNECMCIGNSQNLLNFLKHTNYFKPSKIYTFFVY